MSPDLKWHINTFWHLANFALRSSANSILFKQDFSCLYKLTTTLAVFIAKQNCLKKVGLDFRAFKTAFNFRNQATST